MKMKREILKPWGKEILLYATDKFVMKELHINKGHRLSLQYHIYKEEAMYVHKGKVNINISSPATWSMNNEEFTTNPIELNVGNHIYIERGWIHRIEALEDSIILECSTNELWDVERIQDDFGRVDKE